MNTVSNPNSKVPGMMDFANNHILNSEQKSPSGMNLQFRNPQNHSNKKSQKLQDLNEMRSIRNQNRHNSKYQSQYSDFSKGKEMQALINLQNKIN